VGGEVGDLCKHLERVFDVNVKGAMLVVRQLLRDALVERGEGC
jgi:NAD(P)-dependent dehydrogenase (short-subunit alcohol dehydrogenase family)